MTNNKKNNPRTKNARVKTAPEKMSAQINAGCVKSTLEEK